MLNDRKIRASNSGITDITAVPRSSSIEELYLSNNMITSLSGLQHFPNLRVLSLSFNKISKISDLSILFKMHINLLNLEGNPITQIPFYQHYVVFSIPTLQLFDGHNVTSEAREEARQRVLFDVSKLERLCFYEEKIKELENLQQTKPNILSKLLDWSEKVRVAVLTINFTSKNESVDCIHETKYDQMRQLAMNFRSKQPRGNLMKWSQIYNMIESIQQMTIDKISANLKNDLIKVQKTMTTPRKSKPKSIKVRQGHSAQQLNSYTNKMSRKSFNQLDGLFDSKIPLTPEIQDDQFFLDENCNPNGNTEQIDFRYESFDGDSSQFVYQMFEVRRNTALLAKCFRNWKKYFSKLCISDPYVTEVPLNENENNEMRIKNDLIHQNKRLHEEVETLKQKLAKSESSNKENNKSRHKMKTQIRQLTKEKDDYQLFFERERIKNEQNPDAVDLKTKFEYEQAIKEHKEMKAKIEQLVAENGQLQKFIKVQKKQQKMEITELNTKLQSVYGFGGRNISNQGSDQQISPVQNTSDFVFDASLSASSTSLSPRSVASILSPGSSPEAFSPDEENKTRHRKKRIHSAATD